PAAKQRRGDWWVVFPSLAVEIFPDQLDLFVVRPTGPETCVEEILVYFVGDGATASEYATARQHVLDNWNALNAEDLGLIERMQRGRHSPGFDGGVLSPFWDGYVGHLSRLVLDGVA
ncbi:MAG: hypothetical protein KDC48_21245, partial [Planctomycetes bacterium]|nr:hypothetical protein [Planctomycetota bacterium]